MIKIIRKFFESLWGGKEAKVSDTVERRVMHNRLTLTMYDGKNLSWTDEDWKGKNPVEPWTIFYKWYFGKDKDYFVMKYKNGETMFKRADIKSFTVQTTEIKESA